MAVHPLAKTLTRSQSVNVAVAAGNRGTAHHRHGMAPRRDHVEDSEKNDDQQAADKQIGRDEEDNAGVTHAAHVHDGEEEKNQQTNSEQYAAAGWAGRRPARPRLP